MRHSIIFRGLLSIILTGVLFLLIPANAAENNTRWKLYFGLLHAHTSISDGEGSVEAAFLQASQVEGLDFFAVTDHSNSFDHADAGSLSADGTAISTEWADGKAAAAAVTDETFVGIFGYEMTWRDSSGLGHISTFGTPGWISRNQEGFSSLEAYYSALTSAPGSVSQFNHPGTDYGDFQNFSHWSAACDDAISLLEVTTEKGFTDCRYYIRALDQGWHVAPTASQNNHNGQFGTKNSVRTVILAENLTEAALYDAMKNRRVYATGDSDLEIYYTLNGAVMGSVLPFQQEITITAVVSDPTDEAVGTLEILTGGGSVLASEKVDAASATAVFTLPGKDGYYLLRIIQPDGDIAVTAPVWVEKAAAPTEPVPSEPESSEPEPSEPPSSEPEPSEPPSSEPEPSEPEPSGPEDTYIFPDDLGVTLYRGLLHAHTEFSDGLGTVEEAFAQAADAEHLDFFAVTDHSNSFDNADAGSIGTDGAVISEEWARGKAAAKAATTSDFTAIFGYEMTWPDDRNLGHISTFGTPGWQSRNQEDFRTLERYYDALTTVPGSVSQFNHPGPDLGEFESFSHYSAKYDSAISLLEVGGGDGLAADGYYTKALDAGWHVAPTAGDNIHDSSWAGTSGDRTVVLAEALTEESLCEAMAQRRVYATQDSDLSLYYTLDGHLMGSILAAGEDHTIRLLIFDPTDTGMAAVEVIADGGEVILSDSASLGGCELSLSVPGGSSYYFLRITQPDGDTAVTAPVWTERYGDVGISGFTADTELPIPGQKLDLTVALQNEESVNFILDSLKLYANGALVHEMTAPGTVEPADSLEITVPFSQDTAGFVTLRVVVTGTAGGISHSMERELTLSFRAKEMVKGILVDLGHSSYQSDAFDNLAALAENANMTVSFFTEDIPEEGSILILPPPERAYEAEFLQQVKIFCARGGSLVVCGCADTGSPHAAAKLNLLFPIAGSTITLRQDTALDDLHNGGSPDALYPTVFNSDTFWCEAISDSQYYAHLRGCTVDPGLGVWLVRGSGTSRSSQSAEKAPVLLAWEELSSGGHILAAGSLFLSDDAMPLPQNRWDAPTANQTILEALLGITRVQLPTTAISEVRKGEANVLYRIKGCTTSGTSNKYTTFPDTIYLQDDTGGIAVSPFRETGIAVGVPMEMVGYLGEQGGNPVLIPVDYYLPEEARYRYVPQTMNHSRVTDYETYGGQLVQVEARVTSVTLTEDGLGVSRFTLTDGWGDRATVMIEDCIRSGAYGTNLLASEVKIGRTVRAMGILHLDSNGIPVLRVRNCEEVVWVPPIPRPGSKENPYTGDPIGLIAAAGAASLGLLLLLFRRRKQGLSR